MQYLWAGLGLLCVALGLVGVVVPLLPTVPFMLLAAFFFAHSSERLHNWLLTHPKFGPAIVDWQTSGAINRRVKRISTVSIMVVFGISLALGLKTAVLIIQAIVLSLVLIFIWTRPDS